MCVCVCICLSLSPHAFSALCQVIPKLFATGTPKGSRLEHRRPERVRALLRCIAPSRHTDHRGRHHLQSSCPPPQELYRYCRHGPKVRASGGWLCGSTVLSAASRRYVPRRQLAPASHANSRRFTAMPSSRLVGLWLAGSSSRSTLLKSVPPAFAGRLSPMQGFALNHAVSFRIVDADVRATADVLDKCLVDHKFEIRGRQVPATPETSPQRRRRFATFYRLQRQLEALRSSSPTRIGSPACAASPSTTRHGGIS